MANIFSKHRTKLREQSKKQKKSLERELKDSKQEARVKVSLESKNLANDVDSSDSGLLQCQILSLSHEGRGIAKNKGKTQFVHYALPGETVLAEVLAHRAKYDELATVKVMQASDQRVEAVCSYYGTCGGCSLQHMGHKAQLAHKQTVLADQLKHFGDLAPQQWLPLVESEPWGYRSRVRLSVDYGRKGEGLRIGFRKKASKETLDIDSCPIMASELSSALPVLKELVASISVHKALGHLELSLSREGIGVLIRHVKPLEQSDLEMLRNLAKEQKWTVFLQAGDISSIQQLWPENECREEGQANLSYNLRVLKQNLALQFHPKDFTQINLGVNQKMVLLALQLLELKSDERALDLFSGLGNFTLAMAKYAKEVVGVEGSQDMVERGLFNAQANDIENVTFYESNLYSDFSAQAWTKGVYDKILIDPPRAGALDIVSNIRQFGAKRIVYISCNPATLARDAGILVQQGYRLMQAGVLDMFPHTEHLESIAVFDSK